METEAVKMAANQGLWALLFVILLFWVLKENSKRESKYQDIISKLSEDIETEVKAIKNKIFKGGANSD